ncbi:MAG: phosphonate ABC transporter, permease protein PhnE [Candidatus Rokubacteria bacterium]|nr:phosphonate ABC transporter, permease protein PhnE [Candidatus Rokubacteria bacterium]
MRFSRSAGFADRLRSKSAFPYLFGLCFVASLLFSVRLAQVDPRLLVEAQALANLARFVGGMFPPELSWSFLSLLGPAVVETIQISVMGTAVACLLAVPLGLLATSTLTWRGILHQRVGRLRRAVWFGPYALSRALLSLFRSIPELVWALLVVRAVGLGPFAGVLALGIAYGGMLGKVYSEILEGVSPQPLEALHAGGAGRLGIVLYGLLPQALPNLLSYTLYRWECAIRASAILGFVGAGGLGQQLELSMRMFQFNEVLTLLVTLFLLVAGVDLVSGRLRAALAR